MAFLAATDEDFSQVVAIDRHFMLFSRAWCIAELAAAFDSGLCQHMKICCAANLDEHEDSMKGLRIQDMEASRPDDVKEILAKIPEPDAFNERLRSIILESLIPNWRCMDVEAKMRRFGRLARKGSWADPRDWQMHQQRFAKKASGPDANNAASDAPNADHAEDGAASDVRLDISPVRVIGQTSI